MNYKLLLKIFVPILMVAVIVSIWFAKNPIGDDTATTVYTKPIYTTSSIVTTSPVTVTQTTEYSDTYNTVSSSVTAYYSSTSTVISAPITSSSAITAPVTTVPSTTDTLPPPDFNLIATEAIDFYQLSQYGMPVIVNYGAESCIPCQQMYPHYVRVHDAMIGKAFIKYVDRYKSPDAISNVPLIFTPTQFIFNADGTPFIPSDELESEIFFDYYKDENGNVVMTAHIGPLSEEQLLSILSEMGVE